MGSFFLFFWRERALLCAWVWGGGFGGVCGAARKPRVEAGRGSVFVRDCARITFLMADSKGDDGVE